MKNLLARYKKTYFNPTLDLGVQLFNALAIVAGIFCIIIAIVNFSTGVRIFMVFVDLAASAFCFGLLIFSSRTGRYRLCQLITIIGVFLILFPFLFFNMGGYHAGFPMFFVLAIVFTAFMLEGKIAIVITMMELVLYIGICVYAYHYPESVTPLIGERGYLVSNILDFVIVSVALGAAMYWHTQLYRQQQKKLDEQNDLLAQVNRAKTEFLSNASHEMRTPLTVISVNVQTVMGILEDLSVKDPETSGLLRNAQGEVMRLARMVGGMLTLASMSENTDKDTVDLSDLLQSGADMLRLNLLKRENTIETDIEPALKVFGSADLLAQVISNLLQNAGSHTENGIITLTAARSGSEITITVRDTGTGISPELLPRVFERGVSDGGTGFGLYLCKTVVESHGGRIWIESEPEKGTTVVFTLPFYEGQFGGV